MSKLIIGSAIKPIGPRAGFIYSQLCNYTQHTACFTENNCTSRILRPTLVISYILLVYSSICNYQFSGDHTLPSPSNITLFQFSAYTMSEILETLECQNACFKLPRHHNKNQIQHRICFIFFLVLKVDMSILLLFW